MSEYAIVRTHGLKTRLLPRETILSLTQAENIENFVNLLKNTEYSDIIPETADLEAIIDAFSKKFWERTFMILKISPENFAEFLRSYLSKFDIDALLYFIGKNILGIEKPSREFPLHGISKTLLNKMKQIKTVDDIVFYLKCYLNYEKVDTKRIEKALETKLLPFIESVLLYMFYVNVIEKTNKLPETTKSIVKTIIGIELDTFNSMIALSRKLYGYDIQYIREMLIPHTHRIRRTTLEKVSQIEDKEEILKLLSPYREIIEVLLEKGEIHAYVHMNRKILSFLNSKRVEIAHDLAYMFYYIKLAEFEWKNLALCAHAIYHHFPPEEIQTYLII